MKNESVRIYVERLRDGVEMVIDEMLEPSLLDLSDNDLAFEKKITCKGKAYLADEHLVVCLKVAAEAKQPCTVCNETVCTPVLLENFYITKPLDEIPSDVFHLTEDLREAIILGAPQFSECNQGNCLERDSLKEYLTKESDPDSDQEEAHYPFKDL